MKNNTHLVDHMFDILKTCFVNHSLDLGADVHYPAELLCRIAELRLPLERISYGPFPQGRVAVLCARKNLQAGCRRLCCPRLHVPGRQSLASHYSIKTGLPSKSITSTHPPGLRLSIHCRNSFLQSAILPPCERFISANVWHVISGGVETRRPTYQMPETNVVKSAHKSPVCLTVIDHEL
jgi:hypothetical protein